MQSITTAARALAALALIMACHPGATARTAAATPVTLHDFGTILEADGPARCRFPIVNTGSEPLIVTGARANCGCTEPRYPRSPVAPGDTAWIDVAYDPAGRPGRFAKKVFVDLGGAVERQVFQIQGTVLATEATISSRYPYVMGPVRLKSRLVAMGDVGAVESRGAYIEGYNCSADTLRPVFEAPEGSLLSIKVQPDVVPPGQQFIYSMVIRSDKHGLWGRGYDTFKVSPAPGSPDSLTVEVAYNVVERFAERSAADAEKAPQAFVDRQIVDFGRITRSEPLEATLTLSHRGGKELLRLRRAYVTDLPGATVTADASEVKRGKSTRLHIAIPAAALEGESMLNAHLDIITNDPSRPVITVRLLGEIVEP